MNIKDCIKSRILNAEDFLEEIKKIIGGF